MSIKILVFDFDGVIVDSLPIRDEGFRQAFLLYGSNLANMAKDFHVRNRGLFRRDKLRRIHVEVIGVRPTEQQINEAESRFVNYTRQLVMDAPLLPGVADFISSPPPIPSYIVSAAPQDEILLVAKNKGLSGVFKEILGGPMLKADHLKKILSREHCSAQSMLFVGDALNDFHAASEADCQFMGIVPIDNESPFPAGTPVARNFLECIKSVLPIATDSSFTVPGDDERKKGRWDFNLG